MERKQGWLLGVVLLVALYAIYKAYLNTAFSMFFNGDTLANVQLITILSKHYSHIHAWPFAPDSYLFPDAIAYYVLYHLFSGDAMLAYMVYVFLVPVYFLFLACWAGHLFNKRAAIWGALCVAALFFLYANGQLGGEKSLENGLLDTAFKMSFHFSSLMVVATCLVLMLKQVEKSSYLLFACNLVLLVLVGVSDPTVLYYFVGPMLLVFAFSYLKVRDVAYKKRYGHLFIQSVLGAVLIWVLYHHLPIHQSRSWHVALLLENIKQFDVRWAAILHMARIFFQAQPVYALLLMGVYSHIFVEVIRRPLSESPMLSVLRLYLIVLIPCLLFVALGMDAYLLVTGISSFRYYLAFLFFPILFYFPWVLSRLFESFSYPVIYMFLFLFVSSLFLMPTNNTLLTIYSYYPSISRCVDQAHQQYALTKGIAGYNQARLVNIFSKSYIPMVTASPRITKSYWENDLRMYDAKDFDFVITTHSHYFDLDLLNQKAGKPDVVYSCDDGDGQLLIYQHGQLKGMFEDD